MRKEISPRRYAAVRRSGDVFGWFSLLDLGRLPEPDNLGGSYGPGVWPSASVLRWAVPGSAIGFGRTVLAIGNGAGCSTPPVGSNAPVDIPVIALFLAFLALRASNRNGWARSWGFPRGQGCERGRGRRCIRPGHPQIPPPGHRRLELLQAVPGK